MIDLKSFKVFHDKLMDFVKPSFSSWHLRILFEAAEDTVFMNYISDIIDLVTGDTTASEWEKVFMDIRAKIDANIPKLSNIENIDEKINVALRITTLAGFLENLTEDSILPDLVMNDFQKLYGDDYLNKLQETDKQYLSRDVQKIRGKQTNVATPQDEIIKKYLLLKQWQDLQHELFVNIIWKDLLPIEGAYMKSKGDKPYFPKIIKYTNQNRATKTRAILKFANQKLISLDDLAVFYLAGLEKEIGHLCGGKTLGLIKLKINSMNIPETYVCPSSCDELAETDIAGLQDQLYAIRSSADCEDGSKHSFAGMFDSFLACPKSDIINKFNNVKQSVNSDRVKTYIATNNLSAPHMAVVIQAFKEPDFSGVWLGTDKTCGYLEWTHGRGDKLVSGEITATTEKWDTDTKPQNCIMAQYKPVGEICIKVQKQLNDSELADLEWCILDGELVFLQYRPVTAVISTTQNTLNINQTLNVIKGISASVGEIEGTARVILDIDQEYTFNQGDILVTKFTSPEWLPILVKAGGVITAHGGPLCHTAIIVRELDIPCIVGIGEENLAKITNGIKIKLNGSAGIATIS